MDAPEAPHQHHEGHTGHRWLDIVLAVSAMFVSVISLSVAIEHGRIMERMAEANTQMVNANTRMVQATSWPFVKFETHNVDEQGRARIRLVLGNAGIGPARIQTFELWWNGRPMSSPWALVKACCDVGKALGQVSLGLTAPNILRAGDREAFFGIAPDARNAAIYDKFNEERDNITTRVCYCSVFDECWVSSGVTAHADPVPSCPAPAVPFRTDVPPPSGP
jgi:hypothetical protein